MKRLLSVVALGLLGLVLVAAASRPGGEFPMLLRLNGSPLKIGTIVSAGGASTTNASTGAPFTLQSGDMIDVVCDAAATCIEAASASTTITAAGYGVPQASGTERFWILAGTSSVTFACAGAGAFNCAVFRMQ